MVLIKIMYQKGHQLMNIFIRLVLLLSNRGCFCFIVYVIIHQEYCLDFVSNIHGFYVIGYLCLEVEKYDRICSSYVFI